MKEEEIKKYVRDRYARAANQGTSCCGQPAAPCCGGGQKSDIISKSIGYTDEQLAQVYDHRAVVALWKAAQYDKLVKSKSGVVKKVAEAPKTLKPGTGTTQNADDKSKKLRQQLKKSGKARDAAALFERFHRTTSFCHTP